MFTHSSVEVSVPSTNTNYMIVKPKISSMIISGIFKMNKIAALGLKNDSISPIFYNFLQITNPFIKLRW